MAIGAGLSGTFVDAVRMAIEDASAEGGLPPLDTILLGESTNRAAPALEIAAQMVAVPGMVAVIGHSNSSSSLAASPIYNQAAVVQIAPTATSARFSEAGLFSFRLAPADPLQGALLARAVDSLQPAGARLALLYVNDDYGRGLREAFLERLDQGRHTVAFDQPHADHELDEDPASLERLVGETVELLAGARPDALLWFGRAATLRRYLPALRARFGAIPILGGDAVSSFNRDDIATGLWDGIRYADYLDADANEAVRDFRARFAARFPLEARTAEVLSYDAARLVLAALRDGARSGEDVRRWLLSLGRERPPWPGLSGPITFSERGDIEREYVLLTMPTADVRP